MAEPEASEAPALTSQAAPTNPASASPEDLEPRRVEIHLPPWVLLLPIAALAGYLVVNASAPLARSASRPSEPPSQPHPRRVAPVSETTPAQDERQAASSWSRRDPREARQGLASSSTADRAPAPGSDLDPAAEAFVHDRQLLERKQAQARELEAARANVEVVVYFTEWCPACRSLRAYLAQNGIRSLEYDVEKDARASFRHRQLNPRHSIPTIDIEGQVLVGFSPDRIQGAIERAARTRIARL